MLPAVPQFSSAGSSDQGLVRPNNEDRVYCDDARGLFLVVDGMGGHQAGEQAADIAVERIKARLERQTGSVEQRLREAITLANNAIYESAQNNPEWKGMACVLTAAVIEDGQVTVGHVGDSRLYKIKRGTIEKITHDHSPVGEREDSGELTETEAMRHPRRNEVYRDVGSEERTPDDEGFIDIFKFAFEPDSALLICSDGLSDAISSERILDIVQTNGGDRWATVHNLIAAATQVGKDNVSVVFVEGSTFPDSLGKRAAKRRSHLEASEAAAGESTGRLTTVPAVHVPWYRGRSICFVLGLLSGAAILYGLQIFVLPSKHARTPQRLTVASPQTIAEAMTRASAGDTVAVAPGTYPESVQLKEGVTLVALRPREAVIQGTVNAEGLQHARLEGFQIRGSESGIRVKNSDVILANDDVAETHGTGVEFSGNSRGAIFACDIHNNTGPGITLNDAASPDIENNVIRNNGTDHTPPLPGLFVRSSLPRLIAGNIFAGNGAEAIWLPAADEAMMARNAFALFGSTDGRPKSRIVPIQEAGHEPR
jgi:parallel beta-helix repeat protein